MALFLFALYAWILGAGVYFTFRRASGGKAGDAGMVLKAILVRMYWGSTTLIILFGTGLYIVLARHDTGIEQNSTLGVIVITLGMILGVLGFLVRGLSKLAQRKRG